MDFRLKQNLKEIVFSTIIYTDMTLHNQLCEDFTAIDFNAKDQNNISENEIKVII